ncbi:MAG: hypothetical protein DMG06_06940, partial [Acidobacteria bacterium]
MKTRICLFSLSLVFLPVVANLQAESFLIGSSQRGEPRLQDKAFIPFQQYSREEDEKILKLF